MRLRPSQIKKGEQLLKLLLVLKKRWKIHACDAKHQTELVQSRLVQPSKIQVSKQELIFASNLLITSFCLAEAASTEFGSER